MDPLDFADPIRLLILCLPERYRAPVAVALSALVASQLVVASIVARLPLAARQHPRWGRVVRALHWYSVLRLRDESGTTKLPGATVAPRALTAAEETVLDVPRAIAPETVASIHHATTLSGRDDGQRGSVETGVLGYLLVLAAVVLAAVGCPASRQLTRPALGNVDGCEPRATRCSPTGRPQVCSGSRRWTDADVVCVTAGQVAAVCCLTRSPITGRELHACVLAERCIDSDGGL